MRFYLGVDASRYKSLYEVAFQPFLRFYGKQDVKSLVDQLLELVSTLLEILP